MTSSCWNKKSHFDTRYEIDGFRSLREFEIILTPGLNVLVGPNGSGKTNFIDFLDFITDLISSGASTAVSNAGGIARVFSQEVLKRKIPRIVAKICGIADISPFLDGGSRKRLFKFEYEFDVRYSKFHTALYIAHERLRLKNVHSSEKDLNTDTTVGALEISRKSPIAEDAPKWSFGTYLVGNAARNPLRFLHPHRIPVSQRIASKPGTNTEARVRLLEETPQVGPDESMLSYRNAFPALEAVRFALSRGRSFNLNPEKARTPDDISAVPAIKPDGSGLSAAIYQMQRASKELPQRRTALRRFRKDSLETIIGWTQLVLPELSDITATADPHTGKYLVFLTVGDEGHSLRVPLQSTSDGTIKWLTFASLAVSGLSQYSIEEPENYLHPKMQQMLIALVRDELGEDENRFVISTHSETIINECKPEELLLFTFEKGSTTCRRIANISSLVEQINDTGFGLGYYYTRNVVR